MMAEFDRKRLEVSYQIFNKFTLTDQSNYYQRAVDKNRKAATQVNRIRAFFAFLTGFVSALAGLMVFLSPGTCTDGTAAAAALTPSAIVDSTPTALATQRSGAPALASAPATVTTDCSADNLLIGVLLILAVVAPALGGAFGTLSDLFQWDRLVTIYEVALENLEVADAKSPLPDMDDDYYKAAVQAFAEGTLSVMRDETAQWGQVIRTPESIQNYIDRALDIANDATSPLPEVVRAAIRSEIDGLRTATEESNRRLEELRGLFAQDRLPDGTFPSSPPPLVPPTPTPDDPPVMPPAG